MGSQDFLPRLPRFNGGVDLLQIAQVFFLVFNHGIEHFFHLVYMPGYWIDQQGLKRQIARFVDDGLGGEVVALLVVEQSLDRLCEQTVRRCVCTGVLQSCR